MSGQNLFKMQTDDLKMWRTARTVGIAPSCHCFDAQYSGATFSELRLHEDTQDTECAAWKELERLIDEAAVKRSKEFSPGLTMEPEMWSQIVTLPESIAKLTSVRRLYLYGSHLVRIPPEIGAMTSLEELDIYTSYRLHWLPFEVTRCIRLERSRASTRALYGNFKYRAPFPRLDKTTISFTSENCSVCNQAIDPEAAVQVWLSLRVATDVLPLLVNACSAECVGRLPRPAAGYVDHPHAGGLDLKQPSTR